MPNAHHASSTTLAPAHRSPDPADTPAPRAHSVVAAAKIAGISPSSMRRRIEDGTIRAVRLGARVLVPVSELERVLSPLAAAR